MKRFTTFIASCLLAVAAFAQNTVDITADATMIHAGDPTKCYYGEEQLLASQSTLSGGILNDALAQWGGTPVTIAKCSISTLPADITIVKAEFKFTSKCTVAGKNSQLVLAQMNSDIDVKTATWDGTDRSATKIADLAYSGNADVAQSCDVTSIIKDMISANTTDVVFGIYTATGREQAISDLKLSVTYLEGAIKEYQYTLNATDGTNVIKQLATGTAYEGTSVNVFYPAIFVENGVTYTNYAGTFAKEISMTGNVTDTVIYQANTDPESQVVIYHEMENTFSTAANKPEMSNGGYGHVAGGAGLEIGSLPAGKYELGVKYVSDGNRSLILRDKDIASYYENILAFADIKRDTFPGLYKAEFTLTRQTTLIVSGYTTEPNKANQSAEVDYIYIQKMPLSDDDKKDCTLTLVNVEHGTVTSSHTNGTYKEGTVIHLEATPDFSYTINSWQVNDSYYGGSPTIDITLDDNTVVTPIFKAVKYKASFFVDDKRIDRLEFEMGETIVPPTVEEKEGFTFKWLDMPETMPAEAISIHGTYEANAPATVTIPVEVKSIGLATICLDKDVKFAADEAGNPAALKAYIATSATDNKVTFKRIYELKAGQGALIQAAPGTYNVTVSADAVEAPAVNYFVGTASDTEVSQKSGLNINCYLTTNKEGNSVGFYLISVTKTIPAGKAYLSAPLSISEGESLILDFDSEDEPTAAVSAKADDNADNVWYTISGTKVGKPVKGINILNGKKIRF